MGRKEFALPDVGEGIAEGELVTWFVDPGEHIEEDQPIAEIETDKALVEIPSPYDGIVSDLYADDGDTISVGEVFVVFEVPDGASEDSPSTRTGSPDDADRTAEKDGRTGTDSGDSQPDSPGTSRGAQSGTGGEFAAAETTKRVFAPPSVRTLARELGVDLLSVQNRVGKPGERLSESDVHAVVSGTENSVETGIESDTESNGPDSTAQDNDPDRSAHGTNIPSSPPPKQNARADRERTLAMPATRRLGRENDISLDNVPASERHNGEPFVTPDDVHAYLESDSPEPRGADRQGSQTEELDGDQPGDRIPYSGVREAIGEKMATSKYTAPHVSHQDEVEVSELVEVRKRLKSAAAERDTNLTYLPFAVKAVVAGLKEVPAINAELDEENEEIVLHDEYNIGIAVASDAGLMVPVIDDADQKGLLELADEISDKAARARDRSIGLEEMQGGTFTITNVGAIGGEYVSPIINYPEAGILALGSLKERPWAEDGEIVARETLPISMSVDHRIVDGAEAARFTNEVKRYLNNPELLLLE
ncbi:hypothetical protein HALLA_02035 (plasmid) [Halostagnicola larsenii XH-48]|uniref:Lipoyl-binding domain-containing protein n=1 Tax=Halostagnicola larsenii XH-48 TaxID=797299 RepID=W0JU43_9EURY|nr:dihydrolipoamide acetyltransferase family protein [Halostagnicola larsenii]AHG02109.1 hypothetical protein HALLA_02035 [Halostagnicola larsenii XH-48]